MNRNLVQTKERSADTGIDRFRYIAALLIIMIHTSPLESVNELADFILTREVARVAVPFFFMVTGYYVVSNCFSSEGDHGFAITKTLKKLGGLYVALTVVYLPLRIYSGYYENGISIDMVFKDLLFDGTFYHLWYLPAAILGITLLYLLSRRFTWKQGIVIAGILYLIGLLGDSYYGLITGNGVGRVYDLMFQVSSYTRNGIFFAPMFLMMGVAVRKITQSKEEKKDVCRRSTVGYLFLVSFIALIMEGILLHLFELQRHDSMYLMLIPTMFFGYQWLLLFPQSSQKINRRIPMLVYFLHPAMIVFVRMVAKIISLQSLLVENSVIFFLLVAASSFFIAWGIDCVLVRNKKQCIHGTVKPRRAWIEINLDHLTENVHAIQNVLKPQTEIMAVVKANAYGHGDVLVSRHLNQLGIRAFAVATIQEAIRLRTHGIQGKILILGYTPISQAKLLEKYHLIQTVFDYEYAKELSKCKRKIAIHIKVDTGMHRLGEDSHNINRISEIFELEHLKVEGMFTHLCAADSLKPEEIAFTRKQIQQFYSVTEALKQRGYDTGKLHIQSSYGLLNYPELECDYVRMGIAMYGVLSSKKDETVLHLPLKPVLSIKSCIVMTKVVHRGESVGYGRQYVAEKDMKIAVVAIGYADGITRQLSDGVGEVLLHGKKVPIIGRICMDQMMLDVTKVTNASAGDEVSIVGDDGGEQILVEDLAASTNTITNEILSGLGGRLPRISVI